MSDLGYLLAFIDLVCDKLDIDEYTKAAVKRAADKMYTATDRVFNEILDEGEYDH